MNELNLREVCYHWKLFNKKFKWSDLLVKDLNKKHLTTIQTKNHSYDIIQSYSAPYFRSFRYHPDYLFFIGEKGLQDKITHGFEEHVFKIILLGYCGMEHSFLWFFYYRRKEEKF